MKTSASILSMYAVTPCHAGSGSSVGVVDLPIQRERHTNWPVVASSGVKGAMRAHFDRFKNEIINKPDEKTFRFITEKCFGSESKKDKNTNEEYEGHAGSVSVSDLKILAYPMRSDVAPFVWITCPAVLRRLAKDMKLAGKGEVAEIPRVDNEETALCWTGNLPETLFLEDMQVQVQESSIVEEIKPYLPGVDRLLVVHDKVFDYGVSQCTSITAQIKIDQSTGTTANGSLRYQEELPSDSIMYSVIFWDNSRDKEESLKMETIKDYISKEVMSDFLQVGGDETCGRGIFELKWN